MMSDRQAPDFFTEPPNGDEETYQKADAAFEKDPSCVRTYHKAARRLDRGIESYMPGSTEESYESVSLRSPSSDATLTLERVHPSYQSRLSSLRSISGTVRTESGELTFTLGSDGRLTSLDDIPKEEVKDLIENGEPFRPKRKGAEKLSAQRLPDKAINLEGCPENLSEQEFMFTKQLDQVIDRYGYDDIHNEYGDVTCRLAVVETSERQGDLTRNYDEQTGYKYTVRLLKGGPVIMLPRQERSSHTQEDIQKAMVKLGEATPVDFGQPTTS